jgi:hypothetical protein
MVKILDRIKDTANSDYRSHIPGIICDIIDCRQYTGLGSTLKVSPLGYDGSYSKAGVVVKHYNVVCSGAVGVYGFPTNMKELFYAYVLTDRASMIEGKVALIIPKTFLPSNPGADWEIEPDAIKKEELEKIVMRKETLVRSRKFS